MVPTYKANLMFVLIMNGLAQTMTIWQLQHYISFTIYPQASLQIYCNIMSNKRKDIANPNLQI